MNFIYHLVPYNLKGTTLYPRNKLKEVYPELFAHATAKYDGREWITDSEVEPLNCRWGDVLFFSPVAPKDIRRALVEAGARVRPLKFFVFHAQSLAPERTRIMHYRRSRNEKRRYDPYDPSDLDRYRVLSQDTIADHKHRIAIGEEILLFPFVPHILYYGAISIEGAGRIEV